jgi:hypothetical protein
VNKFGLGQIFYDRDLFVAAIRSNDQSVFGRRRCFFFTVIVG